MDRRAHRHPNLADQRGERPRRRRSGDRGPLRSPPRPARGRALGRGAAVGKRGLAPRHAQRARRDDARLGVVRQGVPRAVAGRAVLPILRQPRPLPRPLAFERARVRLVVGRRTRRAAARRSRSTWSRRISSSACFRSVTSRAAAKTPCTAPASSRYLHLPFLDSSEPPMRSIGRPSRSRPSLTNSFADAFFSRFGCSSTRPCGHCTTAPRGGHCRMLAPAKVLSVF